MRESGATRLNATSVAQTLAIGAALGAALRCLQGSPIVITIAGELGAGKTTLARGLLRSLGLTGPARSPTYTLIEPYELAGRAIYHLDLYRLHDATEMEALGVRDLLTQDAVLLIEWPDHGGHYLPAADLQVSIRYAPIGRDVLMAARTPAGRRLEQQILSAIEP